MSWSGFLHPHQTVLFRACIGTVPKTCDVLPLVTLNTTDNNYIFRSLNLQPLQVNHNYI
jgi:hypothetical protein